MAQTLKNKSQASLGPVLSVAMPVEHSAHGFSCCQALVSRNPLLEFRSDSRTGAQAATSHNLKARLAIPYFRNKAQIIDLAASAVATAAAERQLILSRQIV